MSGRRNRLNQTTRRTALCAVLSALAVVALGVGAIIEVFDLSAAAIAATVVWLVLQCYGTRYALLTYAVTAVLGVLLMPQSMASWTFVGLLGYYPVIKERLDRLPRVLSWMIKMLLLAAVLAICLVIFHFVIMGGEGSIATSFALFFGEGDKRAWMGWAVVLLSAFTFVLFDVLINRLRVIYCLRWQKRVERWLKP